MKRLAVASLNFSMPLPGAEELEWASHRSLLEFDIIVVEPTLRDMYTDDHFNGTPLFSQERSLSVKGSVENWRSQIATAFNSGKTIIISLTEKENYFYYTGDKSFSGTGRNARQTNSVAPLSSYEMIPNFISSSQKAVGFKTVPIHEDSEFKERWRAIEDVIQYQFFFKSERATPLAVVRGTESLVAAMISGQSGGTIFLLPPPLIDFEKWEDEDGGWNEQGIQAGRKFLDFFLFLHRFRSQSQGVEAPPEWVNQSEFRLSAEDLKEAEILEISKSISDLEARRLDAQTLLSAYTSPKILLHGKGPALEQAVRDAFSEFGYDAKNFVEADLEFDLLFEANGKRLLGEVEGKDSKAIDVAKISQLSRCLDEDFDRDGVEEYAKGVLFGNPFRMSPPNDRSEGFTAKVVTAAERSGISLVYTYQIFSLLQRMRADSSSSEASDFVSSLAQHPGGLFVWPPRSTQPVFAQHSGA